MVDYVKQEVAYWTSLGKPEDIIEAIRIRKSQTR